MDKNKKNNTGKTGETIAANHLIGNGYKILDLNFQNNLGYRIGEIDIIAQDPKSGEIVFVEVKSRQKGKAYSSLGELAIDRVKYQKLSKIISNYLRRNKLIDCDYRLDAISIELDMENRKAKLKHLKYIYYLLLLYFCVPMLY
ncbi:MAG: YraN family protein [Parcubacteria group bacterium]|jgi:putative endonuclease